MITRLSVDSKSPYGIAVKQLAFVIVGVSFRTDRTSIDPQDGIS